MMAMRGMGDGLFLESMSLSQTAAISKPELTIKEQIDQAESNIKFLENIWENDEEVRKTIDEENLEGIIKSIEAWLDELKEEL